MREISKGCVMAGMHRPEIGGILVDLLSLVVTGGYPQLM